MKVLPRSPGRGAQPETRPDPPPISARPAPAARHPQPGALRSKLGHHLGRPVLGLIALSTILAASVVLVRLGNGDFSSAYALTAEFRSSSAGLHPGSQVLERGVQIGSVRSIVLQNGQALITFGIASQYHLPADSTATIEPQNLFGADQVVISAPAHPPAGSAGTAMLRNGDRIRHTNELDELGQLFATADPLLSRIDTADLAAVVDELSAAYGGQGRQIAASLDAGTNLAGLLARTTQAQLTALDAFTRFNVAIETQGPTLDHLGSDANTTLPLFNSAAHAYAELLSDLGTFSNQFAVLLADYRPKIDTILTDGGNVLRVLLSQRSDVASMLQGLAQYAYRFAHGDSSATLPDGSRFGYFKTFVLWGDVEHLVCSLIAPAAHGLTFLEPLQAAVLGNGSPLNCSQQLSAFQAAQANPSAPSVSQSSGGGAQHQPGSPSGSSNPLSGLGSDLGSGLGSISSPASGAARQLANGLYGALGSPDQSSSTSIASYVDSLLPAP